MVAVATYACDACNREIYDVIDAPTFMPKEQCISDDCKKNKRGGRLQLITRGSKFVKFQELRIQELVWRPCVLRAMCSVRACRPAPCPRATSRAP